MVERVEALERRTSIRASDSFGSGEYDGMLLALQTVGDAVPINEVVAELASVSNLRWNRGTPPAFRVARIDHKKK